MASKIGATQPVIREVPVEGYDTIVTMNAEGLEFRRKGDKHRDKKTVKVTWAQIAEIAAQKQGVDFYTHLGFNDE